MKKSLLALLIAITMILSGCAPEIRQADEEDLIYASFYPIYALSSLVLEDVPGIRLKCLVQPQDDCLRMYDLSDWDASVLAYDADAVIIGGNGLESFESALYSFGDEGPAVITASHGIELYGESSGTQSNEDSDHFEGANPHVYMSVAGALEMAATIGQAMIELYPEKAEAISNGVSSAKAALNALQSSIDEVRSMSAGKSVIVMNEALIYTALDYDLTVSHIYKRESGTTLYGDGLQSALSELSKADCSVILIEKQAPTELVSALEEAGYTVVKLDIMSSYAADSSGADYINVQLANAKSIADAFEKKEN